MKDKEKILFITATHGDEGFSREVFKRLAVSYPRNNYGYDRIVGNPRALRAGVRYTEADLNRSAPGDLASPVYEERRAAQIMQIARNYQSVIDVHGTVADSGIVTIIPYPTLPNLMLASMLPVERNVIWYAKSSLETGPLVQFVDRPAVEIECGPKSSEDIKSRLEAVIGTFLERRATWNLDQVIDNLAGKVFYNVYDRLDGDGTSYADFVLAQNGDEEFYPFMSNQYPGIACYKMRRVNIEEMFLI